MSSAEMERLIKKTIDSLPVPWEDLWVIFQKILQQIQEEGNWHNRK